MLRKALFILFVSFFALPLFALAQTADQISVSVSPLNPGPNESVTITLQSYSLTLESADIEWSLDNKIKNGGIGKTTFTFTTKSIGAASMVTAVVTPVGLPEITKTITITPMSVDILWEASDSMVPPFYRGKALPTSEGDVTFVAIPQVRSTSNTLLPSNVLLYSWQEDYNNDQANSGYSKDSFATSMDYLNPQKNIGVSVSTRNGGTVAAGTVTLLPSDPEIAWYAFSPLYGPLFETALTDTYTINENDTSLLAFPYFFSKDTERSKVIQYSWQLNGGPIDTPVSNILSLHRDKVSTGKATIDLAVSNLTKLFQKSSAHLNLLLQ